MMTNITRADPLKVLIRVSKVTKRPTVNNRILKPTHTTRRIQYPQRQFTTVAAMLTVVVTTVWQR